METATAAMASSRDSSSSMSASLLPAALASLVGYAVYRLLVSPVFVSPPGKIPDAHWSSAISPLWILYALYKDTEVERLAEAHENLGPVVRVGPRDVSIESVENVKTVYTGRFNRTKWYGIFENYG